MRANPCWLEVGVDAITSSVNGGELKLFLSVFVPFPLFSLK